MRGLRGLSGLKAVPGVFGGSYFDKMRSYGPLAYWPLNEGAGGVAFDHSGNGYDGAYTGVTLGQPGIGDGLTCPRFDGIGGWVNTWTPGLGAAYDPDEGSMVIWGRVFQAADWTTDFSRFVDVWLNADNNMFMAISTVDGSVMWLREAAAVSRTTNFATGSPLNWFHMGWTWSRLANEHQGYFNGIAQGGLQTVPNNFAGPITAMRIGSTVGGARFWNGWLAHLAVFDSVKTPAEILDLATV